MAPNTYAGRTLPDGTSRTFERNAFRQITREVDRLGRETRTAYDASGNKTSRTVAFGTPAAVTETWAYNGRGSPGAWPLETLETSLKILETC